MLSFLFWFEELENEVYFQGRKYQIFIWTVSDMIKGFISCCEQNSMQVPSLNREGMIWTWEKKVEL